MKIDQPGDLKEVVSRRFAKTDADATAVFTDGRWRVRIGASVLYEVVGETDAGRVDHFPTVSLIRCRRCGVTGGRTGRCGGGAGGNRRSGLLQVRWHGGHFAPKHCQRSEKTTKFIFFMKNLPFCRQITAFLEKVNTPSYEITNLLRIYE